MLNKLSKHLELLLWCGKRKIRLESWHWEKIREQSNGDIFLKNNTGFEIKKLCKIIAKYFSFYFTITSSHLRDMLLDKNNFVDIT